MVGKSVVTLDGLSTNQILDLLHKAEYIDSHRKEIAHTCDGRVLATLFYEPSTRTRLSFETAMLRLGGKVIGFAGAQLASVTKGESIADTLKTVSNYVDVVAIRHPKEGAALVASRAASVPVINAGDGGHMHPTQTLADLATLQSRFGRITDLTVGLCGDLTFGRTVHSLIETLCRFGNVRFVLISPDELKTPQYVIDRINATDSCSYVEVRDLASVIGDLDVLYMTRVQKDIDLDVLGFVARQATVDVVRGGKIVEKKQPNLPEHIVGVISCVNPRCVTTAEPGIKQMFHLVHSERLEYRCDYCDEEAKL